MASRKDYECVTLEKDDEGIAWVASGEFDAEQPEIRTLSERAFERIAGNQLRTDTQAFGIGRLDEAVGSDEQRGPRPSFLVSCRSD